MPQILTYLILHATDTPEGRMVYPSDIRDWHTWPREVKGDKLIYMGMYYDNDAELPEEVRGKRGRGWRQLGYRDMIMLNGAIHNLVPYDNDNVVDRWEITNGVAGINSMAAHVVYVGGKDKANKKTKDTRTLAQRETMALYVKRMIGQYPNIKIAGHNQFSIKACPCFDVPVWLRSIGTPEKNIYK